MKNVVFVVALCLFSVLLFSCAVPYSFMHGEPDIDTIQIEIVNIATAQKSEYNEEHFSVIKVIENDKKEDFLSGFRNIKSYHPFGHPIGSIFGKAIRIIYSNGDVELITHYGTAVVENGEINIRSITFDSDAFEAFLERYS